MPDKDVQEEAKNVARAVASAVVEVARRSLKQPEHQLKRTAPQVARPRIEM